MMRRRALLTVGANLVCWPLVALAPASADAQQVGKVYRVGLMFTTSPVTEMAGARPDHPGARAFLDELRARGYVEGKNLVLERRSAEGKFERFSEILSELVRLKPDVLVTTGDELAKRAKEITTSVPIVMASSRYPVEIGIVQSLARPGGNVTGLSVNPGPEIEAKRLELLKTAFPKIFRVAFLGGKADWESPIGKTVQTAARTLGLTLWLAEHTPDEYRHAFAMIARERPDAFFVANSPPNFANRRAIVDFATKSRLLGSYSSPEFVDAGGLMSYGVSTVDLFRRTAIYVDKILKGARPGDLPIEQPTKFELVINLKTAKVLGMTVPQELLFRADKVIE